MAWVQVGTHKINTAQVCYIEQEGTTVKLFFHGEWKGNPLELHFDEAKLFWRHLKAEDAMMGKDKGSAAVLPKVGTSSSSSAGAYDVHTHHTDEKPKVAPPAPSGGSHAPSAQPHKHGDHSKHHGEGRKH